jgi:hypothetical protein
MSSQKAFSKRQATIHQENSPSFKLVDISKQSTLYQKGFCSQTLNPPQTNIDIPRTVTIKCLYPHCS